MVTPAARLVIYIIQPASQLVNDGEDNYIILIKYFNSNKCT